RLGAADPEDRFEDAVGRTVADGEVGGVYVGRAAKHRRRTPHVQPCNTKARRDRTVAESLPDRHGRGRPTDFVLRPHRWAPRRGVERRDVGALAGLAEVGPAGGVPDGDGSAEEDDAVMAVDRTAPEVSAADADRRERRHDTSGACRRLVELTGDEPE